MAEKRTERGKKTVKLAKPIEWFGKPLAALELREPTGAEYLRHGDPRVLVRSQTGAGYFVEQNEVIEKYLDDCIVIDGGGGAVMSRLSLQDAMAVKTELLNFFLAAAAGTAATSSTSSSSA